ncbi:MAG: hypothetical protein FWF32_06470, partial [Endomicrobia bacterium]|nr:hypothetical protein [Endomicrobiia bacterium]
NKKENEGRLRLGIQSKFLLFEKNYGKQAPEKLYKTDIAFTKGLKILSFGLLSKWAKRRSTIIQEEYEKFRTSRKR